MMKSIKHVFITLTMSLLLIGCPEKGIYASDKPIVGDFTSVAKKGIPAVVSIKVKGNAISTSSFFDQEPFDDSFDFFQRFFSFPPRNNGNKDEKGVIQLGQGSGFIISSDGYIITNSHVVDGASEIQVILNDGREFIAKNVGQDSQTDIALIKIDAKDLPYLELGDSNKIEVGQWAVAIGTPMGLQASLTVGVVSAKGRNNLNLASIEDFIQTDAAMHRGHSGGALLDTDGYVMGMNTAIALHSGGYTGIGFAIPSNLIKHVMTQLMADGTVTRGFIGVVLQEIDSDLAAAFGLEKSGGAVIAEVTKDSPAQKAGIMQGDIILKYNNQPVENIAALRNAIALMAPGTKVTLSGLRDGKPLQVVVEVGEYPDSHPVPVETSTVGKLGFDVENLTPDIARKWNVSEETGVVISRIDSNSLAAWAGLRKGVVIVAVNQKKINNVKEFQSALQNTPKGRPILFLVKQGDVVRYLSLKVE